MVQKTATHSPKTATDQVPALERSVNSPSRAMMKSIVKMSAPMLR